MSVKRAGASLATAAVASLLVVAPVGVGAAPRMLAGATVEITATQLSPPVLRFPATLNAPSWVNDDNTAHTVTFANGLCTFTLEPGHRDTCRPADVWCDICTGFWRYVGIYPYSVSGVAAGEGEIEVAPAPRILTITTSRTLARPRQAVVLSGTLTYEEVPPPLSRQPITILRRVAGSRDFKRFRTIPPMGNALPLVTGAAATFRWHLVIRPTETATYRAIDDVQPPGGTVWQAGTSTTVTIHVRG